MTSRLLWQPAAVAEPVFSSRLFVSAQERRLFLIVVAATLYQASLCLVNTVAFRINGSLVMLAEMLVYALALACVAREIPRYMGLMLLVTAVNVCLLFLLRGYVEPKSARDLLIVLLFFWLGWRHGTPQLVDKVLTCILLLAIGMGLFEWLALDTYVKLFHTFSYFMNQSGIGANGGAIFEGQALTLNGFRPEGIGRTILPWLFGAHRISSVMLEPVSLGNLAVITLIWAISRDRWQERQTLFFLFAAAFLIALSDSRFGLVVSGLIVLVRLIWPLAGYGVLALAPWAMIGFLYLYSAVFFDGVYTDSFAGRLMHSGQVLTELPLKEWLGWQSPLRDYGDMGYGYILTRFGLFYLLFAWLVLWRIPLLAPRSIRLRGLISIYITMILSISGTSLFALKTAGLLWFMLGTLCAVALNSRTSAAITAKETYP